MKRRISACTGQLQPNLLNRLALTITVHIICSEDEFDLVVIPSTVTESSQEFGKVHEVHTLKLSHLSSPSSGGSSSGIIIIIIHQQQQHDEPDASGDTPHCTQSHLCWALQLPHHYKCQLGDLMMPCCQQPLLLPMMLLPPPPRALASCCYWDTSLVQWPRQCTSCSPVAVPKD